MQRTLALALPLSLLTLNLANASPLLSNYNDTIHLSSHTPHDIHLLSYTNNNANINVTRKDEDSFIIQNASDPTPFRGSTRVTYGTIDGRRYCNFTVEDGPFMSSPIVSDIKCQAMAYTDFSYDGILSYSYSLTFIYA